MPPFVDGAPDFDERALVNPAKMAEVRAHIERIRGDLQSVLSGKLGDVERAFEEQARAAEARVAELEAERATFAERLASLESEVRARVREVHETERRFASELAMRDERITELNAQADRWERKLAALVELKSRVDALVT